MSRIILAALALTLAATLPSVQAQAQNGTLTRSFVSSAGVDSNPCTIAQPCATFAHAYTMIGANGIVAALDPGKYGSLTITGPVTINGNGWSAITGPASATAITINSVSGVVRLTGLEIDGAGAANTGIAFTGGGTLDVENSVIGNFSNDGIDFAPGNNGQLYIADTLIGGNAIGVQISASSAQTSGTLDHVRFEKNATNGISAESSASANMSISISNSVMAGNGLNANGCGLSITVLSGGSGTVTVTDDVIVNNGNGICETSTNLLFIRNSTMTNSQFSGLTLNGGQTEVTRSTISGISGTGTLDSYGDNNLLTGNGPSPVTATFPLQ